MGRRRVMALMVGFYALLACGAALWDWLRDGPSGMATDWSALSLARDVSLGLAAGLSAALVTKVAAKRMPALADLSSYLGRVLRDLFGKLSGAEALLLGVASGVGEEMLFRGCLQRSLGIVIATLLFALPHVGPPGKPYVYVAFAGSLGLVLGGVYALTGSVVAPAVLHATLNTVNLRLLCEEDA